MFSLKSAKLKKLVLSLSMASLGLPMLAYAATPIDDPVGISYQPAPDIAGGKPRSPSNVELFVLKVAKAENLQVISPDAAVASLEQHKINSWVGVLDASTKLPSGIKQVKLDWSASPMAIMRTDTDIKSWADTKGRSMCVSKDSRYLGEVHSKFGAIEDIYPTVVDALVALRIGACDAALLEEDFVSNLLHYPEWKKFSAQLKPYRATNLVQLFNVDTFNAKALSQAMQTENLNALAKEQAKSIAFEVYLDQTVPDCH